MVKPITEVDAKKVVDKFLVLSNQKIEKFQYKIGSEQHQIALSEIKFLSSRARKVTLHGKENEDLLVFSNRSMYMNLLIGKDTPNFAMVKKTPKMFFRFNGEDMPLTTIYNKNKKRRGRSRY